MGKADTVGQIIKAIREKFGEGSALRLSDGPASEVREYIPTGIYAVDRYVLAIGGLPVGRIVELYGEEGTGKTTLALSAAASVQREGGLAIWAETEEAFNSERAATLGVDEEQLLILQPGTIEQTGQATELALNTVPAGIGPILFVWDSIAATPTAREIEDGLEGTDRIGERAKALSKICRSLNRLAVEKRACLLFVNQVREKIGVMFGDKYTTPGGQAVKFHSSVRLQLFGGKSVKDGDEHTGKTITILAAKNRLAPPWRKVQARLDYATGWDNQWTTINHAKDRGLIPESARNSVKTFAEAVAALGWKDVLDPHDGDVEEVKS
jgi:recombination protein RecA